jgi:hypothetical protein
MNKKDVLSLIRSQYHQLTRLGVKSLSVFGSFARDEAQPDSDVDILVEFEGPVTFDKYMDAKFFLEDLLACKVDLAIPQTLKPRLRQNIMRDLIHVA